VAVPSSLTLNYDAILSTTLFNYRRTIEDQIGTSNAFFYYLKKGDGWKTITNIGDRAQIALMYELGTADAYSGYDVLDTSPMDGLTSAFYDWRQASVPIAISGLEELKNASEAKLIDLLKAKTKQALMGLQEFFAKGLLQGSRGTAITTPYVSPNNGASFIDALPFLVHTSGTGTVGNINASTHTWWKNQFSSSSASTFAGFLKEIDHLYHNCSKGPGGPPNVFLCDQNVFEMYTAALREFYRNNSLRSAALPFDNILVKGNKPLIWDEFVPNAAAGSVTLSTSQGTLYMLNTQFFEVQVQGSRNFASTPFVKPENQDAKVAHILWLGAALCSNRRKQGVMHSIDTTIAA
jgi:hypothetical protein